jgi:autotransporter-associated beta strand protein
VDYTDNTNVIFGDTATNSSVTLAQAVYPTAVYFTNSVLDYTVNSSSAGISGAATVTVAGSESVTLTGSQSYTGGTTISSGTYALGADSSTSSATVESPGLTGGTVASLGGSSSPVLIDGGQLRFGGVGGATVYTFLTPNAITVNGGSIYGADGLQELTGGLTIGAGGASILPTWSGKNIVIASTWSGAGPVTIDDWQASGDTAGGLVQVTSAANPYSGAITINPPSSGFLGGVLELSSSTALVNATIIDNNSTNTGLDLPSGANYQIGALGGSGNISLPSRGGSLTAGGNGASTTYSGNFSGSGSFVKTGTGTMILSGTNNRSSGAITVNGGVLELTGSLTSAKSLTINSGDVFYLAGGSLSISGSVTNNGIFKVSGSPANFTQTGAFTNNGVLDLINSNGTLPPRFTNDGTVLYASSVVVQAAATSVSGFSVSIQSYVQHTYQLQSTASLSPTSWTNVGAPQAGTGGTLVLTDPFATGTQGIYRVLVSP